MDYASITIIGRVSYMRDIEISGEGKKRLNFSVAVAPTNYIPEGAEKPETDFWPVVVFGEYAGTLVDKVDLKVGDLVQVTGTPRVKTYKREGESKDSLSVSIRADFVNRLRKAAEKEPKE